MAIKMKTSVTLAIEATCYGHSVAQVRTRDLAQIIDEPCERDGTNLGFTPTDTALSALAGCTNTIGHKCAKKLGVDIGNLKISVKCRFNRLGVTLTEEIDVPFEEIDLVVVADGSASQDDLNKVAVEVAKYCPLAKLYRRAGTIINEDWQLAG
ncbi:MULTISPECIES: OsmC family protein [Halocynthiibacter]|uniref:OsmC family protein n=1 Tax=Halocynthiibacter halioticoli TaxID=2986804 RepID=A0AAE3LUM5_9RHOB|nr:MULTISPECIES: OsmC family protein [Halocynthiibacter]MCV6824835.1 OsmC family protein [Halocynthiibacter halioticoli]MCW4057836.1 OsmC family protein [Halocynthiibacter sp. SDUM655004]